jgi:plastocyanin
MPHTIRTVAIAVGVAAILSACGSEGDGSGSAAVEANGETVEVAAVDNSFTPKEATIAAGTEVVWDNRGRNDHNIIPEDPEADWRVEVEAFRPGDTASHVFLEPGTYRYYCSIHGTVDVGMPGVIVVE